MVTNHDIHVLILTHHTINKSSYIFTALDKQHIVQFPNYGDYFKIYVYTMVIVDEQKIWEKPKINNVVKMATLAEIVHIYFTQ